jgi:hypothetical protein
MIDLRMRMTRNPVHMPVSASLRGKYSAERVLKRMKRDNPQPTGSCIVFVERHVRRSVMET